jgi:hypothetical protein
MARNLRSVYPASGPQRAPSPAQPRSRAQRLKPANDNDASIGRRVFVWLADRPLKMLAVAALTAGAAATMALL